MITKYNQFLLEFSESPTKTKVDRDEVLMGFISPTSKDNYTYLHVTNSEEIANNILRSGFQYEVFPKTVDFIPSDDMVTLRYVRYQREQYGDFVMVIQMDKDLVKKINNDIESISVKNDEELFVLPKEYVKGYYINSKMKFVSNPNFNPKHGL